MADGTPAPAAPAAAPQTTPAVPPAGPAAPATPAPAASSIPWLQGANEEITGYAGLKGWKDPSAVVDSYRNLEKLIGADRAGRTVVLPGDKAEPAEVEAFYNKLGRPAEASGYKLQVPEGQPTEFADTAKSWFHEAGLSEKQAAAINTKWNEYVAAQQAAQASELAQKAELDKQALTKEWGAAHQQNLQLAQRTREALGVSNEEVDGIAKTLGLKRTIELFHKLGTKTGESDFVGGDKPAGFGNALTPAQAKAKIGALRADTEFSKKYIGGDASARAEMERLHKLAYPA